MFPSEVRISLFLELLDVMFTFRYAQCIVYILVGKSPFVQDGDPFFLIAFFANPSIKCSKGQLSKPVKQPGVGFETQDANMGQMRQMNLIYTDIFVLCLFFQKKIPKAGTMFKRHCFSKFSLPKNPNCFPYRLNWTTNELREGIVVKLDTLKNVKFVCFVIGP